MTDHFSGSSVAGRSLALSTAKCVRGSGGEDFEISTTETVPTLFPITSAHEFRFAIFRLRQRSNMLNASLNAFWTLSRAQVLEYAAVFGRNFGNASSWFDIFRDFIKEILTAEKQTLPSIFYKRLAHAEGQCAAAEVCWNLMKQ
jgi:hypothetical protein